MSTDTERRCEWCDWSAASCHELRLDNRKCCPDCRHPDRATTDRCPGGSAMTHCPVHGYNTGRCNPRAEVDPSYQELAAQLRVAARKHGKGSRITPDGALMLRAADRIEELEHERAVFLIVTARKPDEPWAICREDNLATLVMGPFVSRDAAMDARQHLESLVKPTTYWLVPVEVPNEQ